MGIKAWGFWIKLTDCCVLDWVEWVSLGFNSNTNVVLLCTCTDAECTLGYEYVRKYSCTLDLWVQPQVALLEYGYGRKSQL